MATIRSMAAAAFALAVPAVATVALGLREDLEPGATYHGMAAATDIYGNTSYGWGHFTMPS